MLKNPTRTLIKQGGGKHGLNMSVPVEWLKAHGLTKGDKVRVTEDGEKLIIEVIR